MCTAVVCNYVVHTLNSMIPGVSSVHWSPIDVLVTLVVDTLKPTATHQNMQVPFNEKYLKNKTFAVLAK